MRCVLKHLLPALLAGWSSTAAPGGGGSNATLKDEIVECVDLGERDLDGDGVQDLACVTRRGDEEPRRAVVVLSSAPAGAPPALDVPILHCCGGMLPIQLEMMVDDHPPEAFEVSESAGSNSMWTYAYRFERAGSRFRLASESKSVLDRNTGMTAKVLTRYERGVGRSTRTVSHDDDSESRWAEFLNVYALPRKGAIKLDGNGRDAAWQRAPRLPVGRADHIIFERSTLETNEDLSYSLRALWDEGFLYLLIELTDDVVVLAAPGKNGVRHDHVELWFDRAGPPWDEAFAPRMEPEPAKTIQLGLVPIRGTHKVQVLRWFPDEGDLPEVTAAYRKTATGYTIEARFPLDLIGASASYADEFYVRELRKGLVNLTVVASDADDPAAPRQESMIATSSLKHRGAPFEMGLLHLMKSTTPDTVDGGNTASR
ncbi:MAG TPA: sugar-binding protein [Archangium sp.]|uniref:sugar-binding protein n=1 Tax=Archangium sp. TaxID=1872627 RepID=UPI002E34AACB|nr:sugar-binding protein [Archangium sp.]HEX5753112.1 sugar-binding protein [Archangium sp.]